MLTPDSWVSAAARPAGNGSASVPGLFVTFMIFASLGFLNLMTAVFVNSLVELTNADEHRRQQIHREWIGYARDVCAELFALCDEDGDGFLTRSEIMRTLTLMVRRRNMVMRNEQILNDQLTRVMVRMSNADVDFDSMLSAISRFLTKAGVNEMTLSEFTLCVTEMREPPTKEDMMVTSRELDRIQTNHDDLARELARVNEQQGAIPRSSRRSRKRSTSRRSRCPRRASRTSPNATTRDRTNGRPPRRAAAAAPRRHRDRRRTRPQHDSGNASAS